MRSKRRRNQSRRGWKRPTRRLTNRIDFHYHIFYRIYHFPTTSLQLFILFLKRLSNSSPWSVVSLAPISRLVGASSRLDQSRFCEQLRIGERLWSSARETLFEQLRIQHFSNEELQAHLFGHQTILIGCLQNVVGLGRKMRFHQ